MLSRSNGHGDLSIKEACEAAGVPLGFGVDQHFSPIILWVLKIASKPGAQKCDN